MDIEVRCKKCGNNLGITDAYTQLDTITVCVNPCDTCTESDEDAIREEVLSELRKEMEASVGAMSAKLQALRDVLGTNIGSTTDESSAE